jgi:hypothetical protein
MAEAIPHPSGMSEETAWAIGISLAISAQFVGNMGTVLQRRSHLDGGKTPLLRRPLWLMGLFLIMAASVSDFAALNFTSESCAVGACGAP